MIKWWDDAVIRKMTRVSSLLIMASFLAGTVLANCILIERTDWSVQYSISGTTAGKGQVLDLTVTVTAKAKFYDPKLEIISSPVQLLRESSYTWREMEAGLPQSQVFKIRIPEDAMKGTKYQIDIKIEFYRNPPLFDLWGWRPHRIWFMGEDPEVLDTRLLGTSYSIVVTVI